MRQWMLVFFLLWPLGSWAQWNDPHTQSPAENIRHSSFTEQPKTLDPAISYSSNEYQMIAQIYEPLLQYDYYERPAKLVNLTADGEFKIHYIDAKGHEMSAEQALKKPKTVAYSLYDIRIKSGIRYALHPAFAADDQGQLVYQTMDPTELAAAESVYDFKHQATRELTAYDYAYQIKRLASPRVNSKIYALMKDHIVGLDTLRLELIAANAKQPKEDFLDLRQFKLEGVKVLGRYHLQIKIRNKYQQFKYWLAMPFFSPIPWEADHFYSLPGMKAKNFTFAWYPVGTGPYFLAVNDPNKQMILSRNQEFWGETFPTHASAEDIEKGYAKNAGKRMPFVDQFIFSLDKESTPVWNKFLQGYYDHSGISSDSFDQAVKLDAEGNPILTDIMKQKGMRLVTLKMPSIYYIGFNMKDSVVGGYTPAKQALRQAISIAMDYEEYIRLFANGRGTAAHGPIPPGLFGYQEGRTGMNKIVYYWDNGKAKRKPIEVARELMVKAGYPNGVDPATGRALMLTFSVTGSSGGDDSYRFKWYKKQFAKLGISLRIQSTDWSTYQDKMKQGKVQIYTLGWNLDYPDPENFLFLLEGNQGKVDHNGENVSNYDRQDVNVLIDQVRHLPDGELRLEKINQVVSILQKDAPWIWGFNPISYTLSHEWNTPTKPSAVINNNLKYAQLNSKMRAEKVEEWNKPQVWLIIIFFALVLILMVYLVRVYRAKQRKPRVKRMP
jgi:oligopeptide transport system substrate-binding protein